MPKLSFPDRSFWIITAVAVICGLAAGVLGSAFSRVYLLQDYFPGEVDLSDINPNNSGLVIRDPKNVIVSGDVKVAETVANLQPVLVGIYQKAANGGYYRLDQPLFTGLVITADGWVIAQPAAELKKDFDVSDYVAIASDKRLYEIEKLAGLAGLPGDPLIFRLAGASNLPVRKILSRPELSLGESLLVITGRRSVWPTTLAALTKDSGVTSSDTLSASLSLTGNSANDWRNSFVFDMGGNLAAMIAADKSAIPAFSYISLLSDLTLSDPPARPSLGANYLDLSIVRVEGQNLDRGALLYAADNRPAVVSGGAAEKAGLAAGDIITWVNNQEVTADRSLADLIAPYRAGEKITLTYRRGGSEKIVEVTLVEKK